MLGLILFFTFVKLLNASFCGDGLLATSFRVSFGGQFTLGCSQPKCLKLPVIENSRFAYVNGVVDGFAELPPDGDLFTNDPVVCEKGYYSTNCSRPGQWLAGIAPIADLSNVNTLSLRCCQHWAMKVGSFAKVVAVKFGEVFEGGDVSDGMDSSEFEYITNVIKVDKSGRTTYQIAVNRILCNMEPKEEVVETTEAFPEVEENPSAEIEKVEDSEEFDQIQASEDDDQVNAAIEEFNQVNSTNRLFQAPLLQPEEGPIVQQNYPLEPTLIPNLASVVTVAPTAESNPLPDPASSGSSQYQTGNEVQGYQTGNNNGNALTPNNGYVQPGFGQHSFNHPLFPNMQFPMSLHNFPMQPSFMMQFSPPQFNNPGASQSGAFQSGASQGSAFNPGVSGQSGVGQSGFGQSGFGQSGFGQSGFGQSGFGQSGFGQSGGFGQPVGNAYYGGSQYSGGYYPVGSSGFALGGSDALCFTADTIVRTMNGQKKRMDELHVNDWVLSAGGNIVGYSQVNSWAHRKPSFMAEFIKFTLKNGKELKMTKKHYIYKSDCSYGSKVSVEEASREMVYAENVSISDCLFVVGRNTKIVQSRISKIERIQEKGIYSPMTNNGNIIVNDILASCYNIVKNDKLQSSLPSMSSIFKNLMSKCSTIWSHLLSITDYSNSKNEVDLIPGLRTFVEIVIKNIVPSK